MTHTEDTLKKAYENKEEKVISEKIRDAMFEIIKLEKPEEGFSVYKYIMENFSKEQMAHIVCIYVAQELASKLIKDESFKDLCKALKMIYNAERRVKNDK